MVEATDLSRERVLMHQKVEVARTQLARAHADLDLVLAEVRSLPQALKTSVVEALESAFDTLKEAERNVSEVDELVQLGRDTAPSVPPAAPEMRGPSVALGRTGDYDGMMLFFGLSAAITAAHVLFG